MQEQVDREALAITVNAAKLTARGLAQVLRGARNFIVKQHRAAQTPQGKQSVKKLMNHNVSTNTITIDGDRGLFDRVARKWNVDYAFRRTGPGKYLLLFKSGQADAITAAFKEYSEEVMKRARDKRPPIMEQFKKAAELAEREQPETHDRIKIRSKETKRRMIGTALAQSPDWNGVKAFAMILFVMVYAPCVATCVVIYQETRKWQWVATAIGFNTAVAFLLAVIVYQLGSML